MVIKNLMNTNLATIDLFSNNIAQYMRRVLEKGNAIYFYAIAPTKRKSNIDKLYWIRDVNHEEYDMIARVFIDGRKVYCQSMIPNDKVIKLDLTDSNIKKVFDDKFRIETMWASKDIARKLLEIEPLFVKEHGYDFYNFVVAKDNNVLMDALLYGGKDTSISISSDIVHEVDKECEEGKEKRLERWRKLLFPFSRQ